MPPSPTPPVRTKSGSVRYSSRSTVPVHGDDLQVCVIDSVMFTVRFRKAEDGIMSLLNVTTVAPDVLTASHGGRSPSTTLTTAPSTTGFCTGPQFTISERDMLPHTSTPMT